MPRSSGQIRGFVVPVPTPFHEGGRVDEDCVKELMDLYVATKVDALFLLGSFGNGPALRPEERKRVAEVALSQLKGRLPVMVHVGTVDPQTACELGQHARDHGADAIAVVGPYYYNDRPEWEIIEHFRLIGKAVGLPMLVYNNAAYSGYDISPGLMEKLREAAPNIFGSKLAAGTTDQAIRYLGALKQPFSAFIPANNFVEALMRGVKLAGTINPPLASWPELGIQLTESFAKEDLVKTVDVQKRTYAFMGVTGPFRAHGRGTTCELFRARGVPMEQYPRWPTLPFTAEERTRLRDGLERVGFPVVRERAKAAAV